MTFKAIQGLNSGKTRYHLYIHISLTISIHRNITAMINSQILRIPGKNLKVSQKTFDRKSLQCGTVWTIKKKSIVSNYFFYLYIMKNNL